MRIGLTYDVQTDPTDERQAEFDAPTLIQALQDALTTLGHEVVRLGNAQHLLADRQRLAVIDLVFNLAEGSHGRNREAWVPMLLEQWGIPFVGSGSVAQALGLDKLMSKRLARASGVATPNWCVVERSDAFPQMHGLRFPLIVKPRYEGSGVGVDPGAIVHDVDSLRARVRWALDRFQQPCLIEEFIPFGELTIFLIGNHPPEALPAIQRPLDPATRLSCHVVRRPESTAWLCPVDLTQELDAAARALAVTMFEVLRCDDVARVDLRVDEDGTLYFLEINPLPSFDPAESLGLIAEYLGTPCTELVGRILDAALVRLQQSASRQVANERMNE